MGHKCPAELPKMLIYMSQPMQCLLTDMLDNNRAQYNLAVPSFTSDLAPCCLIRTVVLHVLTNP